MAPLPRAVNAQELLDAPAPPADLEESLRDIARLNRFFGGSWLIRAQVARLLERVPADHPVTILDVGTGGADLPVALLRWARRSSRRVRILALDRNAQALDVARRFAGSCREIVFVLGDGLSLPVKAGSVDVALLSLTLHHLEPAEATTALAELSRVARVGFIVNDLVRSRLAYWLVWLATRLFARNRMPRHDGPVSVLRAYTPGEISELARRAGLRHLRIHRYPWLCRLAAVGEQG